MKLEVGKKYATDHHQVAWVEVVSKNDIREQPFTAFNDRGFECYFTSKGECLGLADTPLYTLTEEYEG